MGLKWGSDGLAESQARSQVGHSWPGVSAESQVGRWGAAAVAAAEWPREAAQSMMRPSGGLRRNKPGRSRGHGAVAAAGPTPAHGRRRWAGRLQRVPNDVTWGVVSVLDDALRCNGVQNLIRGVRS